MKFKMNSLKTLPMDKIKITAHMDLMLAGNLVEQ